MFRSQTKFFRAVSFLAIIFVSANILAAQTVEPNATLTTPERLSASFAQVAKKVEPAVVSIDAKGKIPQVVTKSEPAPGDSEDILEFFRKQLPRRAATAVGSGFIVDKSGYILTNAHVVDEAVKISVKLDSGEEFIATVIGTDEETDLAVLKIEAGKDLPFVKLGDSSKAEVGDWVLALGSPFGLSKTVTAGIVSQTLRETPYTSVFQKFIQTDASINRGNSGGPLVNMDGEVIGINSQIATSTGDSNGIGFALPSNEAAYVYGQILKDGQVRRGYMGVVLESVKSEYAKVYGLKDAKGAIVTDVRDSKSAAALAGLQTGDVIIGFDGKTVDSAQDLIAKVAGTSPDKLITLSYLRENGTQLEEKTATLTLAERPSNNRKIADDGTRKKLPLDKTLEETQPFGLTLTELTPELAKTYNVIGQKGLIIKEINPESFIADVKASNGGEALGEGDLIQRLNRQAVTDIKTFAVMVGKLKKGDAVVLHVRTFNPATRNMQLKIVQFTVQ